MKTIGVPLLVLLIILVLGLMLVAFQVRETELAFITRLGKAVRTMDKPGLYFKWPTPIEKVHRYDSRMRVYEADLGETTTRGAVPIIVKTYMVWRVADPLTFYRSVGTFDQAEKQLYGQISDTQNRVIGKYTFAEFVNNDPNQIKIEQIQNEMLADLQVALQDEYGIEVSALGIKQLQVAQDVTEKVFARMRAARNLKKVATESEGEAEATRIRTDAESIRKELLAAADARALAIRGQGDAEAAQYYQLQEAEPAFAIFLKKLEALKTMLDKDTTLVLPSDAPPFDLLTTAPDPSHGK